jgi:E3 ubiquitin-protein ligase HUWE1
LKDFVDNASTIPTRELGHLLESLPTLWPFPRGDLYHWISVLNRFDGILEKFNTHYGLDKGPQLRPFEQLSKKVAEEKEETAEDSPQDIDVGLIKTILRFTALLLTNCGNRSLYASSDRLNDLLHTTDISLLQLTLQLSLLLAKRYYSSKQRMSAVGGSVSLSSHYNISVERVRKLAAPFASPAPPPRQPDTPSASAKGKDKRLSRPSKSSLTGGSESKLNGSDFVSIVKNDGSPSSWRQWADIKLTFYPDKAWLAENAPKTQDPFSSSETPTIRRTTTTPSAPRSADRNVISHRRRSLGDEAESSSSRLAVDIDVSSTFVAGHSLEDALRTTIEGNNLPESSHFDFLQKLRVAKALIGSREERLRIVGIRLLAIANLAYIESEPTFYAEFARSDSEQPRQLQVAFQLAELVQPASDDPNSQVPLELQSIALITMDALTHQKFRANDVYAALNANVNHGILFYMVRKAVDQLRQDETAPKPAEEEWREALFALLSSLPTVMPRAGDLMMSAGLLEILLDVLTLRTKQAERTHWKALTFLDTFVYSVRDGYQTFANAKGLDIAKELTAHVVATSFERAEAGEGMPVEYRAPITDYRIPFYQQSTLRWLFKFINHLMAHNNANFSRQMRNLIDSSEMLESFRKVMGYARIFGSNVWAGAVQIWTTFINNEPTSYSVIAESKLGECFLDALMKSDTDEDDDKSEVPSELSLLPVSEAINAVPQAFQALCLNEAGMKLVVDSGALPKFFKVFTSPAHVKALDTDRELAQTLGASFDELCRHQPTLRNEISVAVRQMIAQVAFSCKQRAVSDGYGAKLWVGNDEGKLFVAGGREALVGSRKKPEPSSESDEDVEMSGVDAEQPPLQEQLSMDEVIESRKFIKIPYPTAFIGAATRFLIGYLPNANQCTTFIQNGGVEDALDLATSPCLPFSFEAMECPSLHDDLGRMLALLSDAKVYILLPALTRRLQKVLNGLDDFLNHDDPSCAFFAPFTNTDRKSTTADLTDPRFADGTIVVKTLVTVNVLCSALCYIFTSTSMYAHRTANNVFLQVNLTDVWVDMVEKLGKLQRSCTWEEILLAGSMPASWITRTAMPHQHFENDNVTDQILRFNGELSSAAPSSDPVAPASSAEDGEDHHKPGTAQFENTRVLRHLFYQAPYEISQFFNAMGKMLLVRRPDPIQKQNATQIAEQLAKSQTEALNFHLPQGFGEIKRLHEYWTVTLVRISSLMVDDSYERTNPQTLTLVLKCFKEQGGFEALEKALESFVVDCKRLAALETADAQQLRDLANTMAGIKLVLHFYSRVINWKLVQDATQTTALAGRSSDLNGSDFSASQFLVELRYAIIKPAMRLWDESESAFMDKAITPVVRNLIEVLRIELDADGESKALSRKDKAPKRSKSEPRKWSPRNNDEVNRLAEDHGREVAMEALYRCYNNIASATEYRDYAVQFFEGREPFLPIPADVIAEPRSTSSPRRPAAPSAGPSETPQPQREDPSEAVASMLLDPDELPDGDEDSPPQLPVLQMNPNALREMMLGGQPGIPEQPEQLLQGLFTGAVPTSALDSSRDASQSPGPPNEDNRPLAGKVADLVTVDDLNEERAKLRTSLIDRCLGILSLHDDVTFELAELIFSSVSKSSTSKEEARLEIANTLLSSLTSLQADEDATEEEQKLQNKRVACYAHLFALVLAKDEFYAIIEDELVDSFELLAGFITSDSVSKGSGAVANILLIVERLLSSDAVPQLIEYNLPNPDAEKVEKHPVVEKKPSLLSLDNKQLLFDALLKILLSVGKNESLALSTLRILVMLTRNPKIASQLGEKQNIRRLFLMARQLQGMTDEKIQGSFLIVLRHIIEDEETILNIMRHEIEAAWVTRPNGRAFDTTTYLRHFSQLAIRSPDLFVKATNDKVAISNYSVRQVPQTLKLKEDPAAKSKKEDSPAANGESSKTTDGETSARPESAAASQKPELERTKTSEFKMPVVENSDGVIHFILSELLNYKEVEDTEPAADKSETKDEQSAAPSAMTSSDVQMGNTVAVSTASEPSTPTPETSSAQSPKKDEKPTFKAEDHPVYIYRCFLLQCLTELLSSYKRTKVEFINFKRKPDAPGTTPSKPRSQVLNYLLHDLIPTGSLGHPEDIASKKREKTSSWAMSVIVSLCSKTGEGDFNIRASDFYDHKEEPELLFVRKFVLEHAIKSYREALTSDSDGLEQRYSRLLSLADLFNRMLTGKPNSTASTSQVDIEMLLVSQRMLAKIMYEKNFISAMTASISEVDLNFPNAKRAVKYILKPLKLLTIIANELSVHSETPVAPGADDESEIGSDSEVSVDEDSREQTPDLFRNSALGILDPGRDEDSDEDEDDEDEDDEDMYDDEFGEEMEYEEEMPDHDEVVSDEEQEIADMGPIEGLPGDVGVDMEIVGMEVEDDDDDEDDSDDSSDSDSDDSNDNDDDEMDEIIDIEGDGVGADDEDWESQPDDEDEEEFPGVDDLESDFPGGPPGMPAALDEIVRALEGQDDNPDEMLFLRDRAGIEAGLPEGHDLLDGEIPEEDEEEEEDFDEEEIAFEPEVDGMFSIQAFVVTVF